MIGAILIVALLYAIKLTEQNAFFICDYTYVDINFFHLKIIFLIER